MEALILLSREEGLSRGERQLIRDLLGGQDVGPGPCAPSSRAFRQRAPFGSSAWPRVASLVLSLSLLGALVIRWLA